MSRPSIKRLGDVSGLDLAPGSPEPVEVLAAGPSGRIERIVSAGHTTPPGHWYDQEEDEWVALLQGTATLEWADGTTTALAAGEAVLIPARRRHRVVATSAAPPAIWIAVFGRFTG
jgi:cupin 2 domain-containing protein